MNIKDFKNNKKMNMLLLIKMRLIHIFSIIKLLILKIMNKGNLNKIINNI
jgi:hypothetical protein